MLETILLVIKVIFYTVVIAVASAVLWVGYQSFLGLNPFQ